jgi:hypothetical protein
VVFLIPEKTKFDTLEVRELNITGQAQVFSGDKENKDKPDVLINVGGVFARHSLVGERVVGRQMQGHIFVANRMLTSPDDLIGTPITQWSFFTDIGSSTEKGGEVIVRSKSGAVSGTNLDKIEPDGWVLRAGYIDGDKPDVSFFSNKTKEIRPVAMFRIDPNQATATGKTAANAAANPITNQTPPSAANVITPTPNNPLNTIIPANPAAATSEQTTNTAINPTGRQ